MLRLYIYYYVDIMYTCVRVYLNIYRVYVSSLCFMILLMHVQVTFMGISVKVYAIIYLYIYLYYTYVYIYIVR